MVTLKDFRLHLKAEPLDVDTNSYPTVVQGGGGGSWMKPLPGVFDILQDFEKVLPLVESLWSS